MKSWLDYLTHQTMQVRKGGTENYRIEAEFPTTFGRLALSKLVALWSTVSVHQLRGTVVVGLLVFKQCNSNLQPAPRIDNERNYAPR
jgi:hypothetical protein